MLPLLIARGGRQVDALPHGLGAAAAASGADLPAGGHNVARDDGDVLVAQRAQHREARVICDAQFLVAHPVQLDKVTNVGHGRDIV